MQVLHRMLHMVGKVVPRFLSLALLMVLPFGYYPDYPDSSQFEIGFGGGYGQVASIARDCSGGITNKHPNPYTDFAASFNVRTKTSEHSDFMYGARLGYFRATARFADLYVPYDKSHVERFYFGPYMAMEMHYFGAGIGMVFNQVPYNFEYDSDFEQNQVGPSGHIRIGSRRGFYFLGSLSENTPLAAGGGHLNLGLGYPLGGKVRLYSAMSILPYDSPGFLQQVDIGLSRKLGLNLAYRAGETGDISESAASATLVFRFGQVKSNSAEQEKGY